MGYSFPFYLTSISFINILKKNLYIPGREFLLDTMVHIAQDKDKLRQRRLILFSDVLIIAKSKNKKFHVVDQVDLAFILVTNATFDPQPSSPHPQGLNTSKPKLRRFASTSNSLNLV